jgi:hypothetical protein
MEGHDFVELLCTETTDIGLQLTTFKIRNIAYVLNYTSDVSDEGEGIKAATQTKLDQMVPLLKNNEILGSEPGVYTWLICDYGEGTPKNIYFKQVITANEFSCKHGTIAKDLCLGKFDEPAASLLRIYCAGEVLIDIEGPHHTFNLLSGTYSLGRIDALEIPENTQFMIKQIYAEKGMDEEAGSDDVVFFDSTGTTFISKDPRKPTGITEEVLRDLMAKGVHLTLYKFDLDVPTDNTCFTKIQKTGNVALSTIVYNQRLAMIERTATALKLPIDDPSIQAKIKKLNDEMKPPSVEELARYRVPPADVMPELYSTVLNPEEFLSVKDSMKSMKRPSGLGSRQKNKKYKKSKKNKKNKKSKKSKKSKKK